MKLLSAISVLVTEDEFKNPPPESDEFLPIDEYAVVYIQMADGSLKMRRRIRGNRIVVKSVAKLPTKIGATSGVQLTRNPREDLLKDNLNILPAGKIPSALLWQIVAFFKSVMDNKLQNVSSVAAAATSGVTTAAAAKAFGHEYEAMAHIVYNTETKVYRVAIPTQRVSKAAVSYDRDNYNEQAGDIMIVDIHSHRQDCAFVG